jgi:hypothetical protein
MKSLEEQLKARTKEIADLETQRDLVSNHLTHEKDKESECCRNARMKLDKINKRIEEIYSQISLLKIRNMMGFF